MKRPTKLIILAASAVAAITLVVLLILWLTSRPDHAATDEELVAAPTEQIETLYGIETKPYEIGANTIEIGETLGSILARYGIDASRVDQIVKAAEPVFSLRSIKAGQNYTTFQRRDSLSRLDYFVYESSMTEYVVFDLSADSVRIYKQEKEVTTSRHMRTATITSSLWNCMVDNGMSPQLAMDLSDIYAWSIDFFGIQEGDNFTVIYDEQSVDTVSIGHGMIWGARFEHNGKAYYAIPFIQDDKLSYWDENGQSLRKNLLKAPLKYSRISSRFSNSRLHPILRIRRPHHGVDYAAPSGTPVVAIGDGVVVTKGYSGGGGNTLKIKHNAGALSSGYLHLRGFAPGLRVGSRVHQGQLIGYVGMTGLATGPHLDFRIWRGGVPIDPLKIPTIPAEPVSKANKAAFNKIRDRIMAELKGQLPDSLKVRSLTPIVPTADSVRHATTDSARKAEVAQPVTKTPSAKPVKR